MADIGTVFPLISEVKMQQVYMYVFIFTSVYTLLFLFLILSATTNSLEYSIHL